MKISVVTAVRNNASVIRNALDSVLSQQHIDLEYIVVDGASTDGTLEIIQSYAQQIHHVISEPDLGVYDALNKGIAMATGDVIALLHSDDYYAHPFVLSQVAEAFLHHDCDAVYANLYYVSPRNNKRIVRIWSSGKYRENSFYMGWMPPHPAFFVKREMYLKYGNFNTQLRFSADYDLMLRFILKQQIQLYYIPKFLVIMRNGGASNRTLQNRFKANLEDRKAWHLNGLQASWLTLLLKPLRKIAQYTWRLKP